MSLFKDFNISSFKKQKPPSNNSFRTMQEVKELKSIPLKKDFVKKYDDIEAAFKKTAEENNIEDYDKSIATKLIKDSAPVILKLKKHFDRPRPKVSAKKMNISMKDYEMKSMKTPSYPSGHSVQGILIGNVLADKHPKASKAFKKTAENISYSRRVAHAHYKSDSKFGEKIGDAMFKHIKNKI
tara:strand:- start:656 stop:1204 length:549 start_codon:yes stop_codon:yes gene_type:complete